MDRNRLIQEALLLHATIRTCPEDGKFNIYIEELGEMRTFERVR